MTAPIALTISAVTLAGHQRARLSDVHFSTHGGGLIGLIGANGAGKSSLLKVLAGILEPDAGQVSWNGQSLLTCSRNAQAQVRSYLPQHEQLPWPVASQSVIELGFSQLGLPPETQQDYLRQVVDDLELGALLSRPVTTLSGGEQQRVLLARALVGQHPLLLVDEPCAGLDIAHQLRTLSYLKQQAEKRLILMAIHDLALAARFCDQLLLLDQGQVLAAGRPASVLSDTNLAQGFGIQAQWFCSETGVAMLPIRHQ